MPTANEFDAALRQHVIDVWFPRCLDVEHGGFLCDFDRAWQPCGLHEKLLEFQARQTWLAADVLRFAPNDERLHQGAVHGFRFLRDVMWDRSAGGWFHRTNRVGDPLEAHTKHAHGTAYAIAACVAVHAATGEVGALDLAREGFAWLEEYAHDKQHGGYFGFLKQDGRVIQDPCECPWPTDIDTINTPIGLKDANVHCDLLETFTHLYRAWPDPKVAERLNELVRLICDKMLVAGGALFYYHRPDWTPIPQVVQYGPVFQTVHRLLASRDLVSSEEKLIGVARRLVDCALRNAWDTSAGGFFTSGPAAPPTQMAGHDLVDRTKPWWVQFEALKALLSLSCAVTDDDAYLRYFAAQWRYLQRYLIDFQQGGVYSLGLESIPRWRRQLGGRFAPAAFTRKGSDWKDGSHDGRVCLYCRSELRANAQKLGVPQG